MNRFLKWLPLFCAALLVVGVSWAQSSIRADQGLPGKYGPWPVSVTGVIPGASVPVTPAQCVLSANKNTSVGVASTTTPAAQLAARRYIVFCNSLQNAGNPLVKCRTDGVAPVMAATNPGDVLGVGDCILYPITAATIPLCISDAAATNVTSWECT